MGTFWGQHIKIDHAFSIQQNLSMTQKLLNTRPRFCQFQSDRSSVTAMVEFEEEGHLERHQKYKLQDRGVQLFCSKNWIYTAKHIQIP